MFVRTCSAISSFSRRNTARPALAVVCLAFMFAVAPPSGVARAGEERGRLFALCVGLKYPGMPGSLLFAADDARAVGEALRKSSGYDAGQSRIEVLVDDQAGGDKPTLREIKRRVIAMADEAAENDKLVFYFSGHGIKDKEGRAVLVCGGGDGLADPSVHLALTEVKRMLARSRAVNKFVAIDACHSGGKAIDDNGLTPDSVALAMGSDGKAIGDPVAWLVSSDAHELSWEDDEGHGLFTRFFLEAVGESAELADRDFDGRLSVYEIYDYVSRGITSFLHEKLRQHDPVWRDRRQTPQLGLGNDRDSALKELKRINLFYTNPSPSSSVPFLPTSAISIRQTETPAEMEARVRREIEDQVRREAEARERAEARARVEMEARVRREVEERARREEARLRAEVFAAVSREDGASEESTGNAFENLANQRGTSRERDKAIGDAVRELVRTLPESVLKITAGSPRLTNDKTAVVVPVMVEVDPAAYGKFCRAFVDLMQRLGFSAIDKNADLNLGRFVNVEPNSLLWKGRPEGDVISIAMCEVLNLQSKQSRWKIFQVNENIFAAFADALSWYAVRVEILDDTGHTVTSGAFPLYKEDTNKNRIKPGQYSDWRYYPVAAWATPKSSDGRLKLHTGLIVPLLDVNCGVYIAQGRMTIGTPSGAKHTQDMKFMLTDEELSRAKTVRCTVVGDE